VAAREAVGRVAGAIDVCTVHAGEDLAWLHPFMRGAAVRASLACRLLNLAIPPPVHSTLAHKTGTETDTRVAVDPAAALSGRAAALRDLSKELADGGRSTGTATHTGLIVTSKLLDSAAHLLDAEAADLNADTTQAAAHRTAARRRAAVIELDTYRDDDPLLKHGRVMRDLVAGPAGFSLAGSTAPAHTTAAKDQSEKEVGLDQLLLKAAALPAPMLSSAPPALTTDTNRGIRPPSPRTTARPSRSHSSPSTTSSSPAQRSSTRT